MRETLQKALITIRFTPPKERHSMITQYDEDSNDVIQLLRKSKYRVRIYICSMSNTLLTVRSLPGTCTVLSTFCTMTEGVQNTITSSTLQTENCQVVSLKSILSSSARIARQGVPAWSGIVEKCPSGRIARKAFYSTMHTQDVFLQRKGFPLNL